MTFRLPLIGAPTDKNPIDETHELPITLNGVSRPLGEVLGEMRLLMAINPALAVDSFSRADGPIGSTLGGKAWTQLPTSEGPPVSLAVIEDGKLVAPQSLVTTTAAYSALVMDTTVQEMRAAVSFLGGVVGGGGFVFGGAGLIAHPPGISHPNQVQDNKCIHNIFSPTHITYGFFDGGVLTDNSLITYTPEQMHPRDGTPREIGWRIDGTTCTFFLPNGDTVQRTHAKFATHGGKYACFEHYWETGGDPQAVPTFHNVSVRA